MTYSTPLQAGSLNRVIQIQSRSKTVDAFGQESTVWTTVLTCRAAIEPLSGSEVVAAGAQLGETMINVTIRWRAGLDITMRILYEGAVFTPMSMLDDYERHRKITMLCSQGLKRG